MDNHSLDVLKNLQSNFKHVDKPIENWKSTCSLGIEIEVKWRYYFPQLWEKYLNNSSSPQLSQEKQDSLTQECSLLEKILLPKLALTEQCGIPKGQDKYYEFAFPPVKNIYILNSQLEILKKENLIPNGNHSIHITIGNLTANKDTYYLLLMLELLMCSKERIASAFHKENKALSSTWARKGMGGIFVKEARELEHNCLTAIELRTLEINDQTDILFILKLTSIISDIIYDKSKNIYNPNNILWNEWLDKTQNVLTEENLIDINWKKPNLLPEYWHNYINKFDRLKEKINPLTFNLFSQLQKQQSNSNHLETNIISQKISKKFKY